MMQVDIFCYSTSGTIKQPFMIPFTKTYLGHPVYCAHVDCLLGFFLQ